MKSRIVRKGIVAAKKTKKKLKSGFKTVKKSTIKFTDKYPKTTFGAGLVGGGAVYGNTEYARVHQNQVIEMQKISKDEIDRRLKKAKQSKREFTWFG